jgi:hypothetical protein
VVGFAIGSRGDIQGKEKTCNKGRNDDNDGNNNNGSHNCHLLSSSSSSAPPPPPQALDCAVTGTHRLSSGLLPVFACLLVNTEIENL